MFNLDTRNDWISHITPVSNSVGTPNGLTVGQMIQFADAMRRERAMQALRDGQSVARAQEAKETELKKAKLLGCWVDGKLRFQSRDHAAIYAYADMRMGERHSVWVAPVGSFVTV